MLYKGIQIVYKFSISFLRAVDEVDMIRDSYGSSQERNDGFILKMYRVAKAQKETTSENVKNRGFETTLFYPQNVEISTFVKKITLIRKVSIMFCKEISLNSLFSTFIL